MHRFGVLIAVAGAALAVAGSAWAHATVSPPVVTAGKADFFTLLVLGERANAATNKIEVDVPSGFAIESFAPSPGWKRDVAATGSGEEVEVHKVTWSRTSGPNGEDVLFQFQAKPDSAKAYEFPVRQTYSDGAVVDWTGSQSSDTPTAELEAKSSLGGGGNTLAIVALAVAVVGLVVAFIGLLTGGGRRPLA